MVLPGVFLAPLRRDVVQFVHSNIAKNRRQAYAVAYSAGEQTSAMSWGTGRAVSRIPRVGGGGTGRSGQGAFGNMCRKGRMFAPTKIYRRWHRKVNVNQRRFAIASALAATAIPALVQARGHKIDKVPEVPLVVSGLESITKTKQAVAALQALGAGADIDRVVNSKRLRAGRGKMRNRRFTMRRGPLVIYTEDSTQRAFRNIPGVDTVHIDRLNLLQLAPGGHMGRFCIWSDKAFTRLSALFGSLSTKSTLKSGYSLPRASMVNADLARLINSTEVQAVVRPAVRDRRLTRQKKNPLRNLKAMVKLNPYAAVVRKTEMAAAEARAKAGKKKAVKKGTRYNKQRRATSTAIIKSITNTEEFKAPSQYL